jgi:hypothetical protein
VAPSRKFRKVSASRPRISARIGRVDSMKPQTEEQSACAGDSWEPVQVRRASLGIAASLVHLAVNR